MVCGWAELWERRGLSGGGTNLGGVLLEQVEKTSASLAEELDEDSLDLLLCTAARKK